MDRTLSDRAKQLVVERTRRKERADKLRRLLKTVSMSDFSADYTLDICIVTDPEILHRDLHSDAMIDAKIDAALYRLETFFASRSHRVRPLPAR